MNLPSEFNIEIEEDVDFEIKSLNFNKYELDDGTILRILNVPTKILRLAGIDPQGFPQYIIQDKNIVSALVPKKLRGKPSMEIFDSTKDKIDAVEFINLVEPQNVYSLADGATIRTRLVVHQVYVSEKRNGLGEPIYMIQSNTSINRKIPDYLRKKK